MKKFLERFKRKKKEPVKELRIHEEWLGMEAMVQLPKEDKKSLKQMKRKR